jgi:hypothetical protein
MFGGSERAPSKLAKAGGHNGPAKCRSYELSLIGTLYKWRRTTGFVCLPKVKIQ